MTMYTISGETINLLGPCKPDGNVYRNQRQYKQCCKFKTNFLITNNETRNSIISECIALKYQVRCELAGWEFILHLVQSE